MALAEHSIFTGGKSWSRRAAGAPPTPQHKWNDSNRFKLRAHAIVRQALRTGELTRGKCEECGSLRVEAHHDNYDLPLAVTWLCRRHHQQRHALLRRAA